MALGGGVFVTQNKILPGSYINFVNASKATATVGDRGVVAFPYALGKAAGTVIEITKNEFVKDSQTLLGLEFSSDEAKPLREVFAHATKCYLYDLGTDGTVKTASDAISALEPYDFNILCVYTDVDADRTQYMTAVKTWRDNGKKCQAVVYGGETTDDDTLNPDHEGIINVVSTVTDEGADAYALVAWVAGAEAGCNVNESCTNMRYDGEYKVKCNHSQSDLEKCLDKSVSDGHGGQFVFHLVYGDVRVLEDINSMVTTTVDKGDDFKYNQTIRVIDQIANDIAKIFNIKYLGKIPNNNSGRVSLWADIVAHHRQLETIQAIENFDSSLVTVEQGATKRSVVVNDVVQVVNAMAQLYMTVVVQ
jgi:hypothetical protein